MKTSQKNLAVRSCVGLATLIGALALSTVAEAAIIVNDSFADAGRNNGADPLDTDWWYSTSNTAIEVSAGSLGLVTGTSGRGIHGTFPLQSLANVGDSLKATFTFVTPAAVGSNLQAGFKIGLFNSNGSAVNADITSSSGSPNALYNPLTGYMMDYDVNFATANIQFRERTTASGQLLSTTADFTNLTGGGTVYSIAANSTYVGVYTVTRTASGLDLSGSLTGPGAASSFTSSDASPTATAFNVLGFHANTNAFGNNGTVGQANNGIDFTNIKIEFVPVPEPCAAMLGILAATLAGGFAVRRRARSAG